MKVMRLYFLLSVLLGVVVIYAAGRAIPNAIAWPRSPLPDLVRFTVILLAIAAGFALLLSHRLLPFLRRRAGAGDAGLIRLVMLLALLVAMGAMRLAGGIGTVGWLAFTLIWLLLFVAPGLAIGWERGGWPRAPAVSLDRMQIMHLIQERLQAMSWPGLVPLAALVLMPLFGLVLSLTSQQTIPEGWLAGNCVPLALAGGLLSTVIPLRLLIRWMPPHAVAGTMPKLLFAGLIWFFMATGGWLSLFGTAIPNIAARAYGVAGERIVTVLLVDRDGYKGCPRGVEITAERVSLRYCDMSQAWLRDLRAGDQLRLTGMETRHGLVIQGVSAVARADRVMSSP